VGNRRPRTDHEKFVVNQYTYFMCGLHAWMQGKIVVT
jgi:hypothetical protein